MLAYLFWHWPEDPGSVDLYERGLASFQEQLNAAGSEGFHGAMSYRVEGPAWLPRGRGYEDWYLLDGSFALDPLNQVAVSPDLRGAHDLPALAAGGGAGGLYRLIQDRQAPDRPVAATWFSKPKQVRYPEFYEVAAQFTEVPGFSFWRRQMVLGPAPEFCLIGGGWPELPPEWLPLRVVRSAVAPATSTDPAS